MRQKRVNVKTLMQLPGKYNGTEECLHELSFNQDVICPQLHKDTYKNTYAVSSASLLLFNVNPIDSHIQLKDKKMQGGKSYWNIKVCRSALLHFLPSKSQWNASL